MQTDDRYVFIAEWFDHIASIVRTFQLMYYFNDKTIELYEMKTKKTFLRRSEFPSITLNDLYINNVLTIYSRQFKLVNYGDQFTKLEFASKITKTLALIKPDAYTNIGKILQFIEQAGFNIGNIKMVKFT